MRGVLLTLALACLLLVVPASAPPQAAAAPGFKFGIQDDAWLGFGPGPWRSAWRSSSDWVSTSSG